VGEGIFLKIIHKTIFGEEATRSIIKGHKNLIRAGTGACPYDIFGK